MKEKRKITKKQLKKRERECIIPFSKRYQGLYYKKIFMNERIPTDE